MDLAALFPTPEAIPAPWPLAEGLMLGTFVAHILTMNAVMGGAMLALAHSLWARDDGPAPHALSELLPTGMAFTVNLGVAPLLFMQVLYGHIFYVSGILMAWWWLSIIPLAMLAYYAAYVYDFRFDAMRRAGRTLAVACLLAGMLAVSFIFSTHITLMSNPAAWPAFLDAPHGSLLNMADPTLFPRWLHFLAASAAVGGLASALLWTRRAKRGTAAPEQAAPRIREGMRWFSRASLLQLGLGSWFLLTLPRPVMLQFMGQNQAATLVFLAALAGVLLLLAFGFAGKPGPALAALIPTVALMAVMREMVRAAYLAPYFRVSDLPLNFQISPLALFLGALVLGLAVVAWVLVQARRACAPHEEA